MYRRGEVRWSAAVNPLFEGAYWGRERAWGHGLREAPRPAAARKPLFRATVYIWRVLP